MQSLLERKLIFVTGKGGVGKSTLAATLGLIGAHQGRRALVVEVGEQQRLPAMFARPAGEGGAEQELAPGLSCISLDPDRALLEWLQLLGGRISGRILASSGTFQYFAAAAPGARELVSMIKIWQLTRARPATDERVVIVDAPATGHALGLLRSPQTFGAIARVGPIAGHARQVEELLRDAARSAYVAVTLGSEMAVSEVLELERGLGEQLQRKLELVLVNALLPRRFSASELERLAAVEHGGSELLSAASRAAHAVHERARLQHNQLPRLRRRGLPVRTVPFVWRPRIDGEALEQLAAQLARAPGA